MRLFFALPLPDAIGRRVTDLGTRLKSRYRALAVPREAGLHFTLFFIGETDNAGAGRLAALLDDPALDRPVIRARFGSIGAFPEKGNPRVIYAAAGEGAAEINEVYLRLRRLLEGIKWPLENEKRPFRPHVTIARNKQASIERPDLANLPLPEDDFSIDRCILFQSVLKPDGAVYTPLKERLFNR